MRTFFAVLLALGLAHTALAEKNKEFAKADTAEAFATIAQSIRNDLEKGGRFEFITSTEKVDASRDLDTMIALLQKTGAVSSMSMEDKVTLFNVQEHLNGLLTHSDSERLICKHDAPMGSHIQTTSCKTYGDIQRDKLNIKDALERHLHDDPQGPLGSCPGGGRFASNCTISGGLSH